MNSHLLDEILEAIWIAEEDGSSLIADLKVECSHDVGPYDLPTSLQEMSAMDLLTIDGPNVVFNEEGRHQARNLIRRQRLAKRLLMDVLDVSEEVSKQMACEFEHFLNSEVTDKVSAFLGHPTVDPNDRPIPPGDNPSLADEATLDPLVMRLSRLAVGQQARVAFLTPSFHKRFDRLAAFGMNPGAELALHQRKPAYLVRLGETELALDSEIAEEIFVRPLA